MAKSPQLESTKRKSIMKVKTLFTHPDAVLPTKAYPNDFCYDCVAVSEEEIAPNVWKYGHGLAFQVNRSWERIFSTMYGEKSGLDHLFNLKNSPINISIDARPRSSVWKTGMVLSNCEGTIDEDFIGEVSAVFYHLMPNI
jgi:dUTPase